MADLASTISSFLTPDMIQKAASLVGESPAATQKSVGIAVPTILSGLASVASSDTGVSQLINMISRIGGDGSLLNDLPGLFGGGPTSQSTMNAGREALQPSSAANWVASSRPSLVRVAPSRSRSPRC